MPDLTEKIDNITKKVRLLAANLDRQRQENKQLAEENRKLKASVVDNQQKIRTLEANLTGAQRNFEKKEIKNPKSSEQLKLEIEQYIAEIDKCIDLLQNS